MIPASENYRPEDALEHVQNSKGTDIPKSFTAKKLMEDYYDKDGNIVSHNICADRDSEELSHLAHLFHFAPDSKPQDLDNVGREMTSVEVLPKPIIWDILACLPTKDVLRCRAVCKKWRLGTSTPDFILTHHRRQPLLSLVQHSEKEEPCEDPRLVVLRNQNLFPVVRNPTPDYWTKLHVYGSCDGLLLICRTIWADFGCREIKFFYVCNPATRQLVGPTQVSGNKSGAEEPLPMVEVVGFYGHSSGEYWALYWRPRTPDFLKEANWNFFFLEEGIEFYVLTVGSNESRCVGGPPAATLTRMKTGGSEDNAPVLYHGCLHWAGYTKDLVVFDTKVETFRRMHGPARLETLFLLELKGTVDLCGMSVADNLMKFWVLQDYEAEVWNFKFQINLQAVAASPPLDLPSFPRKAVLLSENEVLVQVGGRVFLCDSAGRFLGDVEREENHYLEITGHWYQESMIPPPALQSPFLLGM